MGVHDDLGKPITSEKKPMTKKEKLLIAVVWVALIALYFMLSDFDMPCIVCLG